MPIEFQPPSKRPPIGEWVLAFWRHMSPGYQSLGKKTLACGGWFPTRYRQGWGWQAQFLSYRCYPTRSEPELWTPLLQPTDAAEAGLDEAECLERVMRARYGGTKLDCPSCKATKVQFHKLHERRVYACPECLFQIAPTAGTILHDTRTPLASWFRADRLLVERPRMTVEELRSYLGVTYKCAWRIRSRIKEARAAQGIEAQSATTEGRGPKDESPVA